MSPEFDGLHEIRVRAVIESHDKTAVTGYLSDKREGVIHTF
jgi:hypothetical protein